LPTYPFQRHRYWVGTEPTAAGDHDRTAPAGGSAEERFWEAVERADLATLADTLAVDPQTPLSGLLPTLSTWRRAQGEQATIASWRYRISWAPLPERPQGAPAGTWLLLVPEPAGGAGAPMPSAVERALAAGGAQVVRLTAGGAGRTALAARVREALAGREKAAGVLSLLALDESPHPEHAGLTTGLVDNVTLLQALGDASVDAPLWLATRGAVSVGGSDLLASPAQAATWGLGRVAALEEPQRWGGLVDLPETLDDRAARQLGAVLAGVTGEDGTEDQLAVREAGVFARRLVRAPLRGAAAAGGWQPRGTVLVTGGTGGIGAQVARWLVRGGAEHVVLTSRRGPEAPGAAELREELAGLGDGRVRVTVAACDMGDREAVAGLIREITSDGEAVRAVFHAAGVVTFAPLAESATADFGSMADGKIRGAQLLDELLDQDKLEAFVVFSSIAATWGSGGQSAYAAANAYLDAFAERRAARGLPATSVAWGPWADKGMIEQGEVAEHLSRRGLPAMAPELALASLADALRSGETGLVVADVLWDRFVPGFTAARRRPLIGGLPEVRAALAPETPAAADQETVAADFVRSLAGLTPGEVERSLQDLVAEQAAAVLGHASAAAVSAGRDFKELGFDSLTAVELRNRLGAVTGIELPATLIFDYPAPQELAAYLRAELAGGADGLDVFADLDRWETALTDLAADEELRERLVGRLRHVMAALGEDGGQTAAAASIDAGLLSATADEVFGFIDNELGAS
ncbi:SDR family NAD(P)-dependent oxidoreductase, partial [Streptomyces sp. t39]|uniref:SDR family NAD(P)-dependent oxidoreductase n=1 Tax=Streptomyces sp. t39 TaxID=1828156 RepID=UPI0012C9AB15